MNNADCLYTSLMKHWGDGSPYWLSRDLKEPLTYKAIGDLEMHVEQARFACDRDRVNKEFVRYRANPQIRRGRPVYGYQMSGYACYLLTELLEPRRGLTAAKKFFSKFAPVEVPPPEPILAPPQQEIISPPPVVEEVGVVLLGKFHEVDITVRPKDRYVNATQMCKATGKLWSNYWQNQSTKQYVEALSAVLGIPRTELVEVRAGGIPCEQGTYVHPRIATHLAQWCSPEFAVLVSGWLDELLTKGRVELPTGQVGEFSFKDFQAGTVQALKMTVGMLEELQAWKKKVEEEDVRRWEKVEGVLVKVGHSLNYTRASVYAAQKGLKISPEEAKRIGGELTAMCKKENISFVSVSSPPTYMSVNAYPNDFLDERFHEVYAKVTGR